MLKPRPLTSVAPLVAAPGASTLKATVRLAIVALLVALAVNLLISISARALNGRHREQLQIARVKSDLRSLHNGLDNALLGEGLAGFFRARQDLVATMAGLETVGKDSNLASVRHAYQNYIGTAATIATAVSVKDFAGAKRVDKTQGDLSLDRLERSIHDLDIRSQIDADLWGRLNSGLTTLSLLSAAILVFVLAIRYRGKVRSIVELEVHQRALGASERRFRSLIQHNTDVIAVVSAQGRFKMVSDACEQAWAQAPSVLIGQPLSKFVEPSDAVRVSQYFADAHPENPTSVPIELSMPDSAGGVRDYEVRFANLMDDPDVAGIVLTFHEVTDRKRFEQELAHHAFHDRLTGLPNRALFFDRLSHRLKMRGGEAAGFAVLFIDLDNFKVINDSLGHAAGDTLLVEVASRLQSALRPSDTIARLGGDEFTVLLEDGQSAEETLATAQRILEALARPSTLEGRQVVVSCSIGIAMSADSAPDASGLMRDADTAMYRAKARGRAGIAIFERGMNHLAINRLELESDLRAAIDQGQLFLEYQPIVDMATGQLREVEALARWQHPTRGVVAPAMFIPLAEETGLICQIGQWALRAACAQLTRWSEESPENERLGLSVNVSARQLQEKTFGAIVRDVLTEYRVAPTRLKLEITETAMLRDMATIVEVLDELRRLGVRIAIDDFGTGYSSISYLSQLPLDTLKIDRSFVTPLGVDRRADGVVQAMIAMARTLGLNTTGEGIETTDQWDILKAMGCDAGQGYLFARPLAATDVSQVLSERGVASAWALQHTPATPTLRVAPDRPQLL